MSTLGIVTAGDVVGRMTSMQADVEGLNAIEQATGMLGDKADAQWSAFVIEWRKQYVGITALLGFTWSVTGVPGMVSDILDTYANKIAAWKVTFGAPGPVTPPAAPSNLPGVGDLLGTGGGLFSMDTSTKALIGLGLAAVIVVAVKR